MNLFHPGMWLAAVIGAAMWFGIIHLAMWVFG